MKSKMTGVREFRRALRRAPDDLRAEVFDAIKATVDAVHARGRANIDRMTTKRTGELRRRYRKSTSRRTLTGRVGYLDRRAATDLAFYARFIHDGTRYIEARPFHRNAVEAEQSQDDRRILGALDSALDRLAREGRLR